MRKLMVMLVCVVAFTLLGCSHTQPAFSPNGHSDGLAGEQTVRESGPIVASHGHGLPADQEAVASPQPGHSAHGGDDGSVQHGAATEAVESHSAPVTHQHAPMAGTAHPSESSAKSTGELDDELAAIHETLYQLILLVQQHTGDEHLLAHLDSHHLLTGHEFDHGAVHPHGSGSPATVPHPDGTLHEQEAEHHGDEHLVGHAALGHPHEGTPPEATEHRHDAEHHDGEHVEHGHDAEHEQAHHDGQADHDLTKTLRALDELCRELKQHLVNYELRHEAVTHEDRQGHTATDDAADRRSPGSNEPLGLVGRNDPVSRLHDR